MAEQHDASDGVDTLEFQVIDKRKFLDVDKLEIDRDAIAQEKPRYPSYVEELMQRTAETERKFLEKKQQIDEEIGRTRNRLEADYERRLELEKQKLVLPLLEVLDNLERAIAASAGAPASGGLLEGVQMIAGMFRSKLASLGIEPAPALGQPFDPNVSQAIGTVDVSEANQDGIVVEEVQRGYLMNGQLLRPAMVRVGRLNS